MADLTATEAGAAIAASPPPASPRPARRGFAERAGKKILLQRQLPKLHMRQLLVDHKRGLSGSRARTENPGSAILQLRLPGDGLRRMHVK